MKKKISIAFIVLFLIIYSTVSIINNGSPFKSKEQSRVERMESFDAAWKRIDDVYPFFNLKHIDWDSIYSVYRPKVELADRKEYKVLMRSLLAELKDVHVYHRKIIGIQQYPYYSPLQIRDKDATSEKVIGKYFNEKLKKDKSRSLKDGITPEKIGYIHIRDFHNRGLIPEFQEIVKSMDDTKGLIIDIRSPKGGDTKVVHAIALNFLTDTLRKPRLFILNEYIKQTYLIPFENESIYKNRVIVLINGRTISAGELAAEILKQIPNITAIGETTSGGGGGSSDDPPLAIGEFQLPNRMIIGVPTCYNLRYDSLHIEWNGISPDIRVEQTETDIKMGRDKQLEYAINLLK